MATKAKLRNLILRRRPRGLRLSRLDAVSKFRPSKAIRNAMSVASRSLLEILKLAILLAHIHVFA